MRTPPPVQNLIHAMPAATWASSCRSSTRSASSDTACTCRIASTAPAVFAAAKPSAMWIASSRGSTPAASASAASRVAVHSVTGSPQ